MIESLLAEIARRKWFVTNLYQGTDRVWRCILREKNNQITPCHHGAGSTMQVALEAALKPEFEDLF